jgi:type VII secretion-associated protein (TIGR03931 family)
VSTHLIEVGPTLIRQLCCGGNAFANDEMVRAAFDSIDDPVALVDLRPVTVDALWRSALGSVDCGDRERAIVVYPSWWPPVRIDVVSAAADVLGREILLRPRSWLLRQACPREAGHGTVVVEIADGFVVVSATDMVAQTRCGEIRWVVDAVVSSVAEMTHDANASVVIDASSTVVGAVELAALIAERMRASGQIGPVLVVDDAGLQKSAAEIVQGQDDTCESLAPGPEHRRPWQPALLVLLLIAVFGVLGAFAFVRHDAPEGGAIPTTFLVEGRVAVQVPADWRTQRIVAGPGSARVQVTSPSDPEMSLHITQSRVAVEALSATAEFLKQAIDAQPVGIFVDFNPAGKVAGRPAVTYREIRSGHDIRWTVLVDKAVRISIGCQSRHGREDAMRSVCELAVRSAHALS